ncbi:MAG: fluoride efflux transporter CrcB [Armatimonadota bacterium]|nr:fluoride efflux transporter CrcB [Armatimonadota bacterium]MDR7443937.1 fluoride efflux transporter CrcB [Armatimonadota bacterium]MDR7570035.1 fluoride efflux transporter CrcB [Armatimonadota bacterium]MDR7613205.1 fluoride efflux transporter CrcB [Armatimonadota bacterium]
MRYVLVLFGGALGALARYVVDGWVVSRLDTGFPFGTLVVNLSGSFLLGVLSVVTVERLLLPGEWRVLLGIGFLGAYTTFSTWQYETFRLLEAGQWGAGLVNLFGSAVAGFAALVLGVLVGRVL